ncbi:MAG: M24B family metallopeptidase, partial [Eubacteriales bacterium]|nr:M24B family metallopeptidase [Eubacteriales bacterium]
NIVASGKNACTLHYVTNNADIVDGDLVLIDAGAEFGGYAGDISRTFPANGRFSNAQKDVYEAVLDVNQTIIATLRAGISYSFVSDLAVKLITEKLMELKLLSGSLEENIAKLSYRRFYMHGIGHWLGLDVHDVGGRLNADGTSITLKENMCMTVEPGIYIPDDDDIPQALRGIGVRIEDNVIITSDGAEEYTREAPKTVHEIEALYGVYA